MGFWESIDSISKEDLAIIDFEKTKEEWKKTNQLSRYNPLTDKFYEEDERK